MTRSEAAARKETTVTLRSWRWVLFDLIQAADGNFYRTTGNGGAFGSGTIFKMTPAGDVIVLHAFNGTDGGRAQGSLLQATDGSVYGMTSSGGTANRGTIFKVTSDGTFALLHSFDSAEGTTPFAGLIQTVMAISTVRPRTTVASTVARRSR